MSTNKTENYGLHAWVAGDDFLREEINENFETLDGEAARVVLGSYAGDDAVSRTSPLGFTPKALLLFRSDGATSSGTTRCGGLVLGEQKVSYANGDVFAVEGTDLKVFRQARSDNYYQADANKAGLTYRYLAIR